jgi:putative peptidoglycan lipid II flippase
VALHAGLQWWGAYRAGIRLIPRAGWRDPEVRVVVRRALPSLAQAGLVAVQVLCLLTLANRVPGGVVAFQIALNFYFLAIALGATPVALSLLPRLARMHVDSDLDAFRDALRHGFALGLFIAIPAAVGYFGLSTPLARAVSFGKMSSLGGVELVAGALAALSIAVIAQTVFLIATYASYARKDTRSPLVSMVLQAVVCLALASSAFFLHGSAIMVALGLAFSVSITVAALHLALRLRRELGPARDRLLPSLARAGVGAGVMIVPAWVTAKAAHEWFGSLLGPRVGILTAAVVGTGVFIAVEAMLRTPELAWLLSGFAMLRRRARRTLAEVSDA